jgi:RimJ/RimL family protein N-acetyltransferase
MNFERTTDYELIRAMATRPEVWDAVSDDFAQPVENWAPMRSDLLWYVIARDGEEVLGFWMFVPHSPVSWEIHTCLLPECGYRRARLAAREMLDWLWRKTSIVRLVTNVPEYNRAARAFAKAAGMVEFGTNERSYMKNGVLHDQIMLGISRPEVLPTQAEKEVVHCL